MIRRDEGEVLHGVGGHRRRDNGWPFLLNAQGFTCRGRGGLYLWLRVTLPQGPLVSALFFVLKPDGGMQKWCIWGAVWGAFVEFGVCSLLH